VSELFQGGEFNPVKVILNPFLTRFLLHLWLILEYYGIFCKKYLDGFGVFCDVFG
jgi:hypothetical protein